MNEVGLKLSTMRDIDLCIQDDRPSWIKLIEGDDHRLTKAVSHLVDQRRDGYLILPWTRDRHLLDAFETSLERGSTLMAELIQATKAYYLTVEGFVTGNPLLLNLRRVAGHITRERGTFAGGRVLKNRDACANTLMNGHWEELIGKLEELLHATDDPDNYHVHIQRIIQYTSDGRQRLVSFLRGCSACSRFQVGSKSFMDILMTPQFYSRIGNQASTLPEYWQPIPQKCSYVHLMSLEYH